MLNSRILVSQVLPWILCMAIHAGLLLQFNVPEKDAILDASIFSTLLFLAAFSVALILGSYRPSYKNSFAVLSWNAILAFAVVFLYRQISEEIINPSNILINLEPHGFSIFVVITFLVLCTSSLLNWLYFALKEREEAERWKAETERLGREAELRGLKQQLQPHFLFNSLNSVNALLNRSPQEAREMIQNLSDFLRGIVWKESTNKISLREEMDQVELYFKIEKVRFGHRLQTSIEMEEGLELELIPAMMLQPLVENAIKFGLYGTTGEVSIQIFAKLKSRMLEISVRNPYDTDAGTNQRGTGFGLSSVARRLYLIYTRNDLMQTEQSNGFFTTTIRIPLTLN